MLQGRADIIRPYNGNPTNLMDPAGLDKYGHGRDKEEKGMKHGLKWMVFCLLALVIVLLPMREAKALEIISAKHTDEFFTPIDEFYSSHLKVIRFTYTITDQDLEACKNGNWADVKLNCNVYVKIWNEPDTEPSDYDAIPRSVEGRISGYTPPTCTQNGSITVYASYTASYDVNDTSSGSVDKLGHDWPDTWSLTEDGKSHTRACQRGCGESETFAHSGGTATCTEKAVCVKCGKPCGNPMGHDWALDTTKGDNGWEWAADGSSATAYLKCQRQGCAGAETTATDTAPQAGNTAYDPDTGKANVAYTATVTVDGKTFTRETTVSRDITIVNQTVGFYNYKHEIVSNGVDGSLSYNEIFSVCEPDVTEMIDQKINCHDVFAGWSELTLSEQSVVIDQDDVILRESYDTTAQYEALLVRVNMVPATCVAAGKEEYWTCETCGNKYSDEKGENKITEPAAIPIDQNAHDWDMDHWSFDGSKHWHVCKNGCTEKLNEADHSGGAATCTAKAKCDTCEQEYGDYAAHDWDTAWTTGDGKHWHKCKTPGCTAKNGEAEHSGGTATCQAKAKCAACGEEYGDKADHNWDTAWTTGNGKHWHKCKTQGCTEKNGEAEHSGGTATCQEKAKCASCGEEYGEKNPNNHAGPIVTVKGYAATCTETGLTDGKQCEACKAFTVEQETIAIDKDAHPADKIKDVKGKAATCTETGLTDGKQCEACKAFTVKQETIAIDKDAHPADKIKDVKGKVATCTETGLTDGKQCEACKAFTVEQEEIKIDPDNHAGSIVDVKGKAATCTETGLTDGKQCEACKAFTVKQEVIPAKGHVEATDAAVEPTCTETGLTEGTHCSVCGEVFTAQETIPALGHAFGAWQPYVQGRHGRGCYRYGYEMTARCTLITVSVGDESAVTLCPVCGYREGMKALTAVRGGKVKGAVPDGVLRVFVSEWDAAFRLMVIAFESDGRLVQPKGEVTVTLPAEIINGDSLALVGPEGEETPVDYETDGEKITFTLNFMSREGPLSALALKLLPKDYVIPQKE